MEKQINFTPTSNNIITTCLLELEDFKFSLGKDQPKIKQIQQVVSVGPRAVLKVGDWVVIDHSKYIKHVKVKSQIRAGIGGEDMIREEFVPPFIDVPDHEEPLLKISESDIEGVIDNYDVLTDKYKEGMSMLDYEAKKLKAEKEFNTAKEDFIADISKNTKEVDKRKGPMIITETTPTR